MLNTVHTTDVL